MRRFLLCLGRCQIAEQLKERCSPGLYLVDQQPSDWRPAQSLVVPALLRFTQTQCSAFCRLAF